MPGGRPRKAKKDRLDATVALRMKPDLVEAIDKKHGELVRDHPEITWSRGQVIRHLLYRALGLVKE